MGVVEVRTFVDDDREPLRSLFRRAGEGAPSGSLWGDEQSEADVYLTPCMDHEPDSLFVAVVEGAIAGYLAGSVGARGSGHAAAGMGPRAAEVEPVDRRPVARPADRGAHEPSCETAPCRACDCQDR